MKRCIVFLLMIIFILLNVETGRSVCRESRFECKDKRCLKSDAVCDGVRNCPDGEDENENLCKNKTTTCWSWLRRCGEDKLCKNNTFQCDNGKCIPIHKACDGIDNCGDGSDERNGLAGVKCALKGPGLNTCNIPDKMVFDGRAHCRKHLDERPNKHLSMFMCFDQSTKISAHQQCDGVIDCQDLSDECPCEDKRREKDTEHICYKHCSAQNLNNLQNCTPGYVYCDNGTKAIEKAKICDGVRDCQDDLDERYCTFRLKRDIKSFDAVRCAGDIYGSKNITAKACDGFPECFDLKDECDSNCPNTPLFCKLKPLLKTRGHYFHRCESDEERTGYFFTVQDICNGEWSPCKTRIPEEEVNCTERFYCNETAKVGRSIAMKLRCDGFDNCGNMIDEQNCKTRYKCDKGPPYSVPMNFVSDGIVDCADASDECPYELDEKYLSTRYEMIGSRFLKVWVWFIGFAVIFANSYVIFTVTRQYRTLKNEASLVLQGNWILIINLAAADLIMGIYLISIAIGSVLYSGRYCKVDIVWRSSMACSTAGAFTVISSEVSILTLVIIATLRMITVLDPLKARLFKRRWAILLAFLAWTIGVIVAYVPMFPKAKDRFTVDVWLPTKFLQNTKVNFTRAVNFLKSVESYANINSSKNLDVSSWDDVINNLPESAGHIRGRFGYYSRHAICVPDFYLTDNDPGWELPMTIITFNFIAMLYLPLIYIIIYKKTAKVKVADTVVDRSAQMQRRIFKLVVSDFLCWTPICVMAAANIGGAFHTISQEMYAVTAIVLLPINSVLNPLLYSDAFEKLARKTRESIVFIYRKSYQDRKKLSLLPAQSTPGNSSSASTSVTPRVSRMPLKLLHKS